VTQVKIWLSDWEQECCGPTRNVGDEVLMSVYLEDGKYIEQRHDYGNNLHGQPITARIESIEWCPAIVRRVSDVLRVIEGYGPGAPLTSTDSRPAADGGDFWALAFTVTTDDPLPRVS
jgi:hypothetical protein